MKQIAINNYLVVEVPSANVSLSDPFSISPFECMEAAILDCNENALATITLHEGQWESIFRCSDISEEIAKEVVTLVCIDTDIDKDGQPLYRSYTSANILHHTACGSFDSLLEHHSLNPANCWLLKRK